MEVELVGCSTSKLCFDLVGVFSEDGGLIT